jgi:hypothetical protein
MVEGEQTIERVVFWDVTPCTPVGVYLYSGGTYHLCGQRRRVSQANNQQEVASFSLVTAIRTEIQCRIQKEKIWNGCEEKEAKK